MPLQYNFNRTHIRHNYQNIQKDTQMVPDPELACLFTKSLTGDVQKEKTDG
jgi:hypothetical protein